MPDLFTAGGGDEVVRRRLPVEPSRTGAEPRALGGVCFSKLADEWPRAKARLGARLGARLEA